MNLTGVILLFYILKMKYFGRKNSVKGKHPAPSKFYSFSSPPWREERVDGCIEMLVSIHTLLICYLTTIF